MPLKACKGMSQIRKCKKLGGLDLEFICVTKLKVPVYILYGRLRQELSIVVRLDIYPHVISALYHDLGLKSNITICIRATCTIRMRLLTFEYVDARVALKTSFQKCPCLRNGCGMKVVVQLSFGCKSPGNVES